MLKVLILSLIFLFSTQVFSQENTINHTSPNGVLEVCRVLDKIPNGEYSESDLEKESEFCSINFYSPTVALCPKTWSTSPATMVRDISGSEYDVSSYVSSRYCGARNKTKGEGVKNLAKFKSSMNQGRRSSGGGTSGTYSPSSLAYYHVSRYLGARVKVPVSVYREMDRSYHFQNITPIGLAKSRGSKIKNGWRWFNLAGNDPDAYSPREELVTVDASRYKGVLIKGPGERYGVALTGRRTRSWGRKQHVQMMDEVAPFLALKSDKPLLESVEDGLSRSRKVSSGMRAALSDVSNLQMVSWMRELSEIVVLDRIFGQQDRVGNIDYKWYWAYVSDKDKIKYKAEKRSEYEELSRSEMASSDISLPDKSWVTKVKIGTTPVLIQKTFLNDNDAGARDYRGSPGATIGRYTSFPDSAKWVDGMKHFSAKLYERLMTLNSDLQSEGPIYLWAKAQLGMNDKSLQMIVDNTKELTDELKALCSTMKFDLDQVGSVLKEGFVPEETAVDCNL